MKTLLFFGLLFPSLVIAQTQSGQIFREYSWAVPKGIGQEVYVRVCGDGYYGDQTRSGVELFNEGFVRDGWFTLPQPLDLQQATRAELVVEKMLCHDGSTGLAVKFNEGGWHVLPEASNIPQPQADHLHHLNLTIPLPLADLKSNGPNRFRFTINQTQRWGMPQNMVYGLVLRVYYQPGKAHAEGQISSIKAGDVLGEKVVLQVKNTGKLPIEKVEYLGLYEGLNLEGDGLYRQWHYHYHRGELHDHLGTSAKNEPFVWQTEWLPDQREKMQILARVTDTNGLVFITEAVDGLTFNRNYSVELAQPYDIPKRWATREREFTVGLDLKGTIADAEKFMLVAKTWSPAYLNGLYLNDYLLMAREACHYCYHVIRLESTEVQHLKSMNFLKTGLTPLVKGKMVHGTEIQYPGFMLLVKYRTK
jgi:hypothetical protein